MASFFDTMIGIVIVGTFIFLIVSKIYQHEKDHIDPLIKKIKGWFSKDDEMEGFHDPTGDYDISFRGQQQI